jgi:bifunctional UDP-N-acetylglucosamine pyrophosphorylase/glucosamine-1-phosphate N-acetyltransferase
MVQPIILAAGKGTRMQSDLPKALFPFSGKAMLDWVLEAMARVEGANTPIVVVGHKGDSVRDYVGTRAVCVEQKEISGTASAVMVAMPHVPPEVKDAFIMYVDHPFITPENVAKIVRQHKKFGATITLGTVRLPDYSDWRSVFMSFGRVIRDPMGQIAEIVEYKNANEFEKQTLEINPGFYCVEVDWLKSALPRIQKNELTGEYYLTDILALAIDDQKKIESVDITPEEALGINSVKDAELAEQLAAQG